MNNGLFWFASLMCLLGFAGDQPAPKKGVCPLTGGIMRPIHRDSVVFGTMKATVVIVGKDSLVRSATDGRVREVMGRRVAIMHDTATYTYFYLDSVLVKEQQVVKAGQTIGLVRSGRVSFFVSNYLYTHISVAPQNYVDCVCELPK